MSQATPVEIVPVTLQAIADMIGTLSTGSGCTRLFVILFHKSLIKIHVI
jgi:hypothetical protein